MAENNNSNSSKDSTTYGGDTDRIKMVQEIGELTHIPEIEEYFFRALIEARHIFQDKIVEYQGVKSNLERKFAENSSMGTKEEELPELPKALSKSKTYFFELTRIDNPKSETGHSWDLGKFKLKADGEIVTMIFEDFKKKVDQFEIAPTRIQNETVYSSTLKRSFQINFTKSSASRVIGFVKVVEKFEQKEKKEQKKTFDAKKRGNMLKVSAETITPLQTGERQKEFQEFLNSDREFSRDVAFTVWMKKQLSRLSN